ncbi:type II toxin-antitoxin system HipA family toxin [Pseudoduganella umbonata]|uniref:Serine/threonine-protein kinase HipA n=1 Tax=Pseudoduganella umbonata TaxID=864828 RepID=A0A4P8HUW3_9BURK|nr:HipA domain-containing protein [Pseudoduganella umbonata]MBB3222052.1 serine/threonine-protein kinase HipA [Pseudoduganella umbonata]QCP12294.1 type II toxin-antitoxin system HipA family toxin [Pseudoduganella umbonata]
MSTKREVTVFTWLDTEFVPAGKVVLTEDNERLLASEFAYGTRYLGRPGALEVDPVSLSLKDKETLRDKKIFPENRLSFFGGIRDAAPDAWGRRVIEAKHKVPANSLPESTYLLEAGYERVGALDIRDTPHSVAKAGHVPLTSLKYLIEAAERIEEGLPIPAHLEAIFDGGSALGGARPKATVRDEHGALWLAKFSSKGERLDVPAIEAATLRLARLCGMTVPDVKTVSVSKRKVMLIRRFDRYWAAEQTPLAPGDVFNLSAPGESLVEKRLGFVSGLTLLACDETDARTKSYGDLAEAIQKYCHVDVVRENKKELFARMVYNIFVTNDDDHLRNHGFLWDPGLKGWRLSPLYDVMPKPSVSLERRLFLEVGPKGRDANLDNAMEARAKFGLGEKDAANLIAQVWKEVREWKAHFESFDVSAEGIKQIESAFRRMDDIASRQLRAMLP